MNNNDSKIEISLFQTAEKMDG